MDESSIEVPERKPNSFWEFGKAVLISILIVIPVRAYLVQPFIVDGASMEPNFHGGNYLIIDELTYQFREPVRNDVVVFRYPLSPSQFFIKRIIGLPGETVEIRSSKIYITNINDETFELVQPYLSDSVETLPDSMTVVGPKNYFVLGDNRSHSSDSRVWGLLPKKNIMGRALVRLWPLNQIDFLIN